MSTNNTSKFFATVRILILIFLSYLPVFVFAQTTPTNLTQFVNNFSRVLNVVIPFVIGFGFLGLLTGVLKYIGSGGDEEGMTKGRQLIVYGVIGLFVTMTFWGAAHLLAKTYLGVVIIPQ